MIKKLQSLIGVLADPVVDLFGLSWNTSLDTLSVKKKLLEEEASTKRKILKTIATCFDPYNFDGPTINRARLFLYKLQKQSGLGWDQVLPGEIRREWVNICKQYNSSPAQSVPRFVGNRGSSYRLIAFTDSSKLIYGVTVYIQDRTNNHVSFLLSKNRIVNRKLEAKTIPALEFMGIILGAETLLDLKRELSGPYCVSPINITDLTLYTDSLVCLSWLNSYAKLAKMNKQTVFYSEQTRIA